MLDVQLFYLSISPKTMSIVPIIVAKSASRCPFTNFGKNCKLLKDGDLILHLNGLLDSSLTNPTPNSPFGDSIETTDKFGSICIPECQDKKCSIKSSI